MTRTTHNSLPSYHQLLFFFIPLALSNTLMTLEPLIVNTALARAPRAELTLAAYDVMFGIALVIEAPVIMLLSASTALTRSKAAFRRLARFSVAMGVGAVTVGFLLALTPLYGWLVRDLMDIPPAVAEVARTPLIIMVIWSLPIAWRRFLQGVLIRYDRTPVVTMATAVRLVALVVALVIGGRLMPERMLVVGAIAMQVAVFLEAIFVTPPALAVMRQMPEEDPGNGGSIGWQALISFYQPLATMTILRQVGRPMISAGIAAAALPQLSLAAWSVVLSVVLLPFGATLGLEQLAIAKGRTPAAMERVRRFVWGVGLALTGGLALVAFTPLVDPVLDGMFGLMPELKPLVVAGLRLMAVMPLLQSLQALLRGVAIDQNRTRDIRTAMALALVGVGLVVLVGPRISFCLGVTIGAAANLVAAAAEVGWLTWRDRRACQAASRAASRWG
jgi:Na+-driven multidrug efflux pump